MANPVIINPTLTLAGQAAAFNASGDGLELKITHVSFGTAHYDPTGEEVALVAPVGLKVPVAGASRPTPYQIRMVSAWSEEVGVVPIGEIAFWADTTLVFVWSKADGSIASYKTDGVTYVLFNDLAFSSVPANSISFVVDPLESVALAALAAHEGAYNAHPQYVLRSKFPDYQGHLWGDVTGTANAIVLTLPAIVELTEYTKGNRFSFKAVADNTDDTTINVEGVGPVQVLKTGGVPLSPGSIVAGGVYDVYYDGAKFQLTAGAGFASAEATQAEVTGTTATTSTSWVSVRRLLQAMALKAPLASPALTGTPTAPTAAAATNTTQVATTAFVEAVRVILAAADAQKAPLASPALTGVPAAPTAAPGTNTTQVATTAFVEAARVILAAADALKAPLASPALTGVPTAPTAAPGTNTTQLATTAFIQAAVAALVSSSPAALDTLNELAVALGNDPNFATTITNALALKAPLSSPAFANSPTAPTQAQFDNSTKLTTTAFAKQMGVEYSIFNSLSSTTVLANSSVGGVVSAASASPINVTLPSTTGVPNGATIEVVNAGSGAVTILASGADTLTAQSGGVVPFVLATGDNAYFIKVSTEWRLRGGSMALKYAAVMASANWTTPAQFDNTTKFSTTEFVQRSLGSFSGFTTLGVTTALTAAHVGKMIAVTAAGLSITLPATAGLAIGSKIAITGNSYGTTILPPTGTINLNGAVMASIAIGLYDTAEFTLTTSGWYCLGGSISLVGSSVFGSLLSANGWQKLPGGLILQWGQVTCTTGNGGAGGIGATASYPIAFPNAWRQTIVTIEQTAASVTSAWTDGQTNSAVRITTNGITGSIARYIAIGF